ncbi:MAG TPA: beta-propeller fold lactonase family protein [Kofleriaceae bacterium]
MRDDLDSYSRLCFAIAASLAIGASGCDPVKGGDDAPPDGPILQKPSRSGTITLSDDGSLVAMVNPEDGSLAVFATTDNTRLSRIATGGSPASVVIAADNATAYVANRADGTVVRVTGLDGGTPSVDATIQVGAEPAALALSPTGKQLFVAEYAESRVSIIDTATNEITGTIAVDRPRALMVTNNLDASDADETLVVAEFFGRALPGGEAKDDGRTGYLRLFSLADVAAVKSIALAPVDSGFVKGGVASNPTVKAAANQLGAIATANGRLYVPSIAASPEGPTRFDNNVYPVVYVADLAAAAEVRDAGGTVNLARKIVDAVPSPSPTSPRFLPGDLTDLDFVPDSNVAYAVGRAGDVMIRVTFGSDVQIGSTQNKLIDLAGNDTIGKCQGPTGVVIDGEHGRAYVNCWLTRKLGVVDLAAQSLTSALEAAPLPTGAMELSVQRGKRFYFTGRGRWSNAGTNGAKGGEGWSSCGSCHPDGLTDNMTWVFAAGPRQTTSQDGSFSHGPGPQKQRIFNWTGIFDEHHDFERNTRDVSGGLGAITTAAAAADCNQLDKEQQVTLAPGGVNIGGLQKPLKELADDPAQALCGHKDWDDLDNFVKTIEPVKALRATDTQAVQRGRQLFVDGGCAKCHGGSGWTVSRRFFTPATTTNNALAASPFAIPTFFPTTWMYNADASGTKRNGISPQPAIASADATGPAELAPIPIAQIACSLRNVGTFGVPGDIEKTDAIEKRPFMGSLVRAEGRAGYNVPSLYGLALGAPYLHHGQSPSLTDLFTNTAWQFHTNAGNANFSLALAGAGKADDLVAFLLSIDATTAEIAVPSDAGSGLSFDACPLQFP